MRVALLSLVAAAACPASHADNGRPAAPPYDHDAMVRFHMRERYDLLGAVQHFAIRGDLYDVQVIGRAIGASLDEPGLDRWSRDVGFARANARELALAPSTEEACRRIARLAATCASCHVDAKVTGIFGAPPGPPADGGAIDARMARHAWAADRLFEGVIGGSDESWLAGLDVLAQTPAPWSTAEPNQAVFARGLQDLATRARKRGAQADFAARASVYGDVLVACSGCHAASHPHAP